MISRKIPIGKNERPKENGHVLTIQQPETQTLIIEHPTDPKVTIVANHIELLKRIVNGLDSIQAVETSINDIRAILRDKALLEKFTASKLIDISKVSSISEDIGLITRDLNIIKELVTNLNSVKNIEGIKEVLLHVYKIREAIERVSSFREQLLHIYAELDKFKAIYDKLTEIIVVHEHLLAIEIVAQNIGILLKISQHIELMKQVIEHIDNIEGILNNLDTFLGLVNVYKEMENKLNSLQHLYNDFILKKDTLELKITNMTNDLDSVNALIQETRQELTKLKQLSDDVTNLRNDIETLIRTGVVDDNNVSTVVGYSSSKIEEIKRNILTRIETLVPENAKNSEKLGGKPASNYILWENVSDISVENKIVKRDSTGAIKSKSLIIEGNGINITGGLSTFQDNVLRLENKAAKKGLNLTLNTTNGIDLQLTRDDDRIVDTVLTKNKLPELLPIFQTKQLSTENLNHINKNGLYISPESNQTSASLGYPKNSKGILFVKNLTPNTSIQEYIVADTLEVFIRTSVSGTFTNWKNVTLDTSFIRGRLNLSSNNLNNIKTHGFYYQTSNTLATTELNYPINEAGFLLVMQINEQVSCQEYITLETNEKYVRSCNRNIWTQWSKIGYNERTLKENIDATYIKKETILPSGDYTNPSFWKNLPNGFYYYTSVINGSNAPHPQGLIQVFGTDKVNNGFKRVLWFTGNIGHNYELSINNSTSRVSWMPINKNINDRNYVQLGSYLPDGDLSSVVYWTKIFEGFYVKNPNGNYTNAPTSANLSWCLVFANQRVTGYSKAMLWVDESLNQIKIGRCVSGAGNNVLWKDFNNLQSNVLPDGNTKTSDYWANIKPGFYFTGSGNAGVLNKPTQSAVFHVTTWGNSNSDKVIHCYPATPDRKIYKIFFTGSGQTRDWVRIGNDTDELNRWGNDRYLLKLNPLSTQDLNNIKTNGFYSQDSNANATLARNYPVANKAGSLIVKQVSSKTINQEYTVHDTHEVYIRGTINYQWTPWILISKHTLDIGDRDLNIITQPGNYRQHLANKVRLNQNYPVADKVGVLEVIAYSSDGIVQRYTLLESGDTYVRSIKGSSILPWKLISVDNSTIKGNIRLGDENLNNIKKQGFYHQGYNSKATTANNYPPVNEAGYLRVYMMSGVGVLQEYTTYNNMQTYIRTMDSNVWKPWKLVSVNDETYYNKNKRNASKITTINGTVLNLSYSDNYIVNITASGVFGITEALVGQSGTIVVNNANRITGFGNNIKWQKVPTNLKQKEIFAYFVEDLTNIWMGRLS